MVVKKESGEIVIHTMESGTIEFCVLGTTPYICHRLAQKAWKELIFPGAKKNSADKEGSLKHDPIKEFRDAPYRMADPAAPTVLAIPSSSFKGAMETAALDTPGTKKAQIGRLVKVGWADQALYGVPKVFMAITRSSDINRTPDVRTRALLREWACKVRVTFHKPILREQSITNLLATAGQLSGVGDWRQEKGSGEYGCFKLVSADDPDFKRIVATCGRKAQQDALDNPVAHNDETSEMLAWFGVELKRRGFKVAA